MSAPPTFTARLASARMLSPHVRELTFERADGAPLSFVAGQWVSLVLPLPEGEVRRSYSIASAPDGTPRFEIAVTRVSGGPGSSYLHALEPGCTVTAVGPQGFFTRGAPDAPALFVATGTGVTPLRSMILDAIRKGSSAPMWLLFGVRHESDLLYESELRALAARHARLRVEPTLSQPRGDWPGRRGHVQLHVQELWNDLARLGAPHAYVCGLDRMVSAVRDVLRKQMNVPRQQVHSERYD
jgi:ferredoxin-NADP reductase